MEVFQHHHKDDGVLRAEGNTDDCKLQVAEDNVNTLVTLAGIHLVVQLMGQTVDLRVVVILNPGGQHEPDQQNEGSHKANCKEGTHNIVNDNQGGDWGVLRHPNEVVDDTAAERNQGDLPDHNQEAKVEEGLDLDQHRVHWVGQPLPDKQRHHHRHSQNTDDHQTRVEKTLRWQRLKHLSRPLEIQNAFYLRDETEEEHTHALDGCKDLDVLHHYDSRCAVSGEGKGKNSHYDGHHRRLGVPASHIGDEDIALKSEVEAKGLVEDQGDRLADNVGRIQRGDDEGEVGGVERGDRVGYLTVGSKELEGGDLGERVGEGEVELRRVVGSAGQLGHDGELGLAVLPHSQRNEEAKYQHFITV